MKRIISFISVIVFAALNVFAFVGCSSAAPAGGQEVRACWVCSVGNMDFPSDMGLSKENLRREIDAIIRNCKETGLNTIFFQVRPNGDALYDSSVFPWSVYLSGKQGVAPDGNFDPLEYFVQQAHRNGIDLHAWLNPYRIGSGKNVWNSLSKDNPAVIHPEYAIESETGLYYDPGLPEVRALILDGIAELVQNYEIDGIHFDDYFYPYDLTGFDDSATFKKYGKGRSLADFRRESVDELVRSAYTLIKSIDPLVEFGISPFGIWANKSTHPAGSKTSGMSSYAEIFSDSKKWVEEGWLDYICPQVYWSFEFKRAPFDVVVDWWDTLCRNTDVKLYIGIALYKIDSDEAGWDEDDQVQRQLEYASKKKGYNGHCFFRYDTLIENPRSVTESIKEYYSKNVQPEVEDVPIDPITLPQPTELTIASPLAGITVDEPGISVTGTTEAGRDVTVNGMRATVSEKGFYAAYVPLEAGSNTLTVRSGNQTKSISVTYRLKSTIERLDLSTAYPNGDVEHSAGDLVKFSVCAPEGSSVTLTNGELSFYFEPQDPTHYSCRWTVPSFPGGDKLVLKDFVYKVRYSSGEEEELPLELILTLCNDKPREFKYLSQDAHVFDESVGGSQMDHLPLSKGSSVEVVAKEGTRALLQGGYWIEQSALSDTQDLAKRIIDHPYQTIEIKGKVDSLYAEVEDSVLSLYISGAEGQLPKIKSGSIKLGVDKEFDGGSVELQVYSKANYPLAGFEIQPKSDGAVIHVHYLTDTLRGKTVMLDAGHGGADCGALGPGGEKYPSESELNMLLTSYLKQELEASGAKVILSRGGNTTLSLQERVEYSSLMAPDLFISLHHNSTQQTADYNCVSGGLVLYSSPISEGLAESLAEELWAGIGAESSVPVRRQSLYVCRQTHCPAVLIEAGYLCNPVEYEKLCKPDNGQRIAKNIVRGLKNYFITECS